MKRLVVALAVAAFASTALAADGAELYAHKCAACHGKDASGGAMYKQSIRGKPEAEVLNVIKNGKGKMKPNNVDDPAAVAKYVSSLK